MAKSGVSYIVGRESNATYGETHNGVFVNTQFLNVDPYVVPGNPASGVLPGLTANFPRPTAPPTTKSRPTTSASPSPRTPTGKLPWTAPPDYDPAQYELLKRAIQATNPTSITQLLQLVPLGTPNGANKYDINANGNLTMVSTDYVGFSKDYPNADYATRQQIITAHRNYEQGYLYFLATDPSVPQAVRDGMNSYGLTTDEFTDNGGWSDELYVREARRMIGRYVMTEADDLSQRQAPDPIALGSYTLDSHGTSFFVDANGKPHAEGNIGVAAPQALRHLLRFAHAARKPGLEPARKLRDLRLARRLLVDPHGTAVHDDGPGRRRCRRARTQRQHERAASELQRA